MPYYIVESFEDPLFVGGVSLRGIQTIRYSDKLKLYVVSTKERPEDWPDSPRSKRAGHRRAPDGVKDWWVVIKKGAKARSNDELRLRSDGEPLNAPPPDYPVFNWPFDAVHSEGDTANARLADDLKAIMVDHGIDSTEKETTINARIGQGAFRDGVLRRWDQRCAVTGSSILDAIRASHIKPWRDSSNEERLDPNNGLPLVASLDALFDVGLISFDESGILIVSPALNASEREIFGLAGLSLRKMPSTETARYLEYHRKDFFRR